MTKVLIIDDSKMILSVAKDIIEMNIFDADVTIEDNPSNAMKLMEKEEYHIIILDIVMPEITGVEVLKWIKSHKRFDAIKVIMFTSLNDGEAIAKSFKLGAYDYITKPLEQNEFIARVNHAINEYKQNQIITHNFEMMAMKNQELEVLNKKLKNTQSELIQSEKLASVGYLAAGMAHEINNPLGYVSSNISTLNGYMTSILELYENVRSSIDKKNIDALEKEVGYDFIIDDSDSLYGDIKQGLKRIEDIVAALRSYSKIDVGDEIESKSVKEMIQSAIDQIYIENREKVKMVFDENESMVIQCNVKEFEDSIKNLLVNAFESIKELQEQREAKVRIAAYQRGQDIEIIIDDNGMGMTDDVKKHSIDPFFTTKDIGEGIGLGLTTAYNCFVNNLKGSLSIDTTAGEGTRIIIRIPYGR